MRGRQESIIVTGGAGFIGSHIVDRYIEAGHHVAVVDNLATGFRKNVNTQAKFYKADIRDERAMRRIMAAEQPSIVNHQAALVEIIRSMREPEETFATNVLGTANVITAFGSESRSRRKKFLFASTGGAIYGEPSKLPVAETISPAPLSTYGLSKHMAEETIRFFCQFFGMEYLIFRYANVYGPRQNPKGEAGVVAIFGGLLQTGVRATIFGDGTKTRDYVHVDDIARANFLGLHKGENAEVNLGWGRAVSDRDVFNAVASFYDHRKPPRHKPFRRGEVRHIRLDARKALRILGWQPKIEFKEGVHHTLNHL